MKRRSFFEGAIAAIAGLFGARKASANTGCLKFTFATDESLAELTDELCGVHPGDVVMLKSGGPFMVVDGWFGCEEGEAKSDRVVCRWPSSSDGGAWWLSAEIFPSACLEVISRSCESTDAKITDGESHRAMEAARIMQEHKLLPYFTMASKWSVGYSQNGKLSDWWWSEEYATPTEALIAAEPLYLKWNYEQVNQLDYADGTAF